MPALTSTDAQIEIRATEAFRAYLAQVAGLTTLDWRRADDPRELTFPVAVVVISNLRQAWAGSDEMEGVLQVIYTSRKDPDADSDGIDANVADLVANQTAHMGFSARCANALADQEAIRSFVNAGAVSRAAEDFHFYGCFEHEEPGTEREGTTWITELRRRVVIARVDYEVPDVADGALVDEDGVTPLKDEDDTDLIDE